MPKNKSKKGNYKSDTSKYIIPAITYPNNRAAKTNIAIPSEENVEQAKSWVDFNEK